MRYTTVIIISLSVLYLSSCQEDFEVRLEREAQIFTSKQCPIEIEPGCILDSVSFSTKQRTYIWWYKLSDKGIHIIRENTPILHSLLVERVKDNIDLKILKDKYINFGYVYRSNNYKDSVIYETTIYPKNIT